MKVCIVIGHTLIKHGANYGCFNEYVFNSMLAREISFNLGAVGSEGFIIKKDDLTNSEIFELVDYQNPKAIIELHCNAFNGEVKGTEVLFTNKHRLNDNLAIIMQKHLCEGLNRKGKFNRGHKLLKNGDRGYKNLYKYKNPACLIEPFFIDNKDDLLLGLNKDLSKFIVSGLLEFNKVL